MKILAIDTSSKEFSAVVFSNGKVIASHTMASKGILSSSIMPTIKKLLKKSKLNFRNLDGFAVGLGPGSFTGLRVGLATIKGLAFALQKPVVGISSLDVLAMNAVSDGNAQICTLCDAKRNLVYWCLFEKKKGRLVKKRNYSLTDVETLLASVKRETVFIGDGINLLNDVLRQSSKKPSRYIICDDETLWYPKAENLALLSVEKFCKASENYEVRLKPLYLYPDDCQVTHKKR